MKVSKAKEIARKWVGKRITELPNVTHAFFHGSSCNMNVDADLPATSDVDIRFVVNNEVPDMFTTLTGEYAQQYHLVNNLILDTSYMSSNQLTRKYLAFPSELIAVDFRQPNAIFDPNGELERIQRKVQAYYRDVDCVRQRCDKAREAAHNWFFQAANSNLNKYGWPVRRIEAISWLYLGATPAVSQIPCVANLQGITLRTCLVKSRHTLSQYGYDDVYQKLLLILGLGNSTKPNVESSLLELSKALRYARSVHKTRFYGDHHLQKILEPLVIDGSRELIDAGLHKEVMLWVVGMRDWVQNAIENDGTEPDKSRFRNAYDHMLVGLGIIDEQDVAYKTSMLKGFIPQMMDVANEIIDKHPDIHGQR